MSGKYNAASTITKDEYVEIVSRGDNKDICKAIVDAVHTIPDYHWLLGQFSEILKNSDTEIRGVAITCIGHLARISDEANKGELLSVLIPYSSDPEVFGRVEDAIDDIEMFL